MRETEILRGLAKTKQNCFQAGMVPSRLDELRARAAAEKDPRRKAAIESGIRDAELEEAEAAKRAPVPAKTPAATPVQTLPAPQPTMPVRPVSAPQPTLRGAAEALRGRSAESMGKKYGFERGTPFVEAPRGVSKNGDHVPAMLEHGEAVLPKATVAAVGAKSIQRLIEETTGRSPKQGLRGGLRAATGAVDVPERTGSGALKALGRTAGVTGAVIHGAQAVDAFNKGDPYALAGHTVTGLGELAGPTRAATFVGEAGGAAMGGSLAGGIGRGLRAADQFMVDKFGNERAQARLAMAGPAVTTPTAATPTAATTPAASASDWGNSPHVGQEAEAHAEQALGMKPGELAKAISRGKPQGKSIWGQPGHEEVGTFQLPNSATPTMRDAIRNGMMPNDLKSGEGLITSSSGRSQFLRTQPSDARIETVQTTRAPAPSAQSAPAQPEVVQRVDTPSPFTEAGRAGSWDSLWEAKRQALRSDALNKANAEAFNAGSGRMNAESGRTSAEASMLRAQNEPILAREKLGLLREQAQRDSEAAKAKMKAEERKDAQKDYEEFFKTTGYNEQDTVGFRDFLNANYSYTGQDGKKKSFADMSWEERRKAMPKMKDEYQLMKQAQARSLGEGTTLGAFEPKETRKMTMKDVSTGEVAGLKMGVKLFNSDNDPKQMSLVEYLGRKYLPDSMVGSDEVVVGKNGEVMRKADYLNAPGPYGSKDRAQTLRDAQRK